MSDKQSASGKCKTCVDNLAQLQDLNAQLQKQLQRMECLKKTSPANKTEEPARP